MTQLQFHTPTGYASSVAQWITLRERHTLHEQDISWYEIAGEEINWHKVSAALDLPRAVIHKIFWRDTDYASLTHTDKTPSGWSHQARAELYNALYDPWLDTRPGRLAIFERDTYQCWGCRQPVDPQDPDKMMRPSVDCVIPMVHGGHFIESNMACMHLVCNLSKGGRPPNEDTLQAAAARPPLTTPVTPLRAHSAEGYITVKGHSVLIKRSPAEAIVTVQVEAPWTNDWSDLIPIAGAASRSGFGGAGGYLAEQRLTTEYHTYQLTRTYRLRKRAPKQEAAAQAPNRRRNTLTTEAEWDRWSRQQKGLPPLNRQPKETPALVITMKPIT